MSQAERVESEELKRAEPAGSLQQEHVELEQLYRTAPVGLCFLDTELRYVRINERLAEINGKPVSAHIGRLLREIIPELVPTLEPMLQQILQTGEPVVDLEVHAARAAEPGVELDWLCSYYPVKSEDGRVLGITAVVQDVTELKRSGEESLLLKEYLDSILLNLPVGVAILEGPDFRYFRINKRLADLNGLPVEDHLGRPVAEVLPDSQNILPNLRKVRNTGKPILNREFSTRLPNHPDKQAHLMDFHFPIRVGGEIRAVGAVVLDITERKRAEEALHKAHEELERRVRERTDELRENEERLRRLLESTSAMPWMADARTWLFTYVGPRAVDILGYPLDQWYEKDFWVNHIHPEDREAAIDFCIKSLRSLEEFEFEYRMIAADGSIVWLHDLVSVVRENGEPQTLQGFMIDVTERKQLEEESRQHKAALAHITRVSTLGELAASLSHELNQPLTAIVSNAQATLRLLSRDTPDLDELRAALTDITDDGKRAGEVIHRLRTMQKKGDSRRDRLDINEVIREVLSLYRSDAMLKDISVELDLALNLPPVLGDQIQLQQVVLNLLLNASEAVGDLEPGSRKVVLRTSRVDSNTIEVNVRDFGTGLAPENGDRIFDAFFTTKPEGMGMGLSISRSIIEEHGGRLWATQSPERGATFHFTLPVNNGVSR